MQTVREIMNSYASYLMFTFFAIHYYNEYACKSKKIISEKGKMFLKSLQNMQIIKCFAILSTELSKFESFPAAPRDFNRRLIAFNPYHRQTATRKENCLIT